LNIIKPEEVLLNKEYSKEIISDPELLPEVEDFFQKIADELNLNEKQRNNLTLSAAEAVSNCIVHGNKLDKNKKVFIKVTIDGSNIEVRFKDEGKGFLPEEVPDPTAPENILKDSGRGIHIMKSFLNDLKYNFTPDGTEAILIMNIE
jgi:serine/threonine-protein kinase RsbW